MEVWLVAGIAVVVAVVAFVLLNRRGSEVIDAPRQVQSTSVVPAASPPPAAANEDLSAGDVLKAEGADELLQHFADWLQAEATEEFGTAAEQPGPTRRIADAARTVMPVILTHGSTTVDLPEFVIGATGGRNFYRDIDIAELERAVAHSGILDVRGLTEWRRDATRVCALASWLEDQVFEDMPPGHCVSEDDTVRIVAAAWQAIADIDRTGRADIALVAICRDSKGQTFDMRRSVDATKLQTIITEYEEVER